MMKNLKWFQDNGDLILLFGSAITMWFGFAVFICSVRMAPMVFTSAVVCAAVAFRLALCHGECLDPLVRLGMKWSGWMFMHFLVIPFFMFMLVWMFQTSIELGLRDLLAHQLDMRDTFSEFSPRSLVERAAMTAVYADLFLMTVSVVAGVYYAVKNKRCLATRSHRGGIVIIRL